MRTMKARPGPHAHDLSKESCPYNLSAHIFPGKTPLNLEKIPRNGAGLADPLVVHNRGHMIPNIGDFTCSGV